MVNKKINESDEGFAFHVKPIIKDAKKSFEVFNIKYSKSSKNTFSKISEDNRDKKVQLFHIPYRRTSKRLFVHTISSNWAVIKKLHAEVGMKYKTKSTHLIFQGLTLIKAVFDYNARGKYFQRKFEKLNVN